MNRISPLRIGVMIFVTLFSTWELWPTARYFAALRQSPPTDPKLRTNLGAEFERADAEGGWRIKKIDPADPANPAKSSPLAKPELGVKEGDIIEAVGAIPTLAVADLQELISGKADRDLTLKIKSPGADAARDVTVRPVHGWEDTLEEMRQKAITLGLDLRGGVDVTLTIDRNKFTTDFIARQAATLNNEFDNKKISAKAEVLEGGRSLSVRALDVAEARNVANILKNYGEQLNGVPSEEQLKSGNPITLTVKDKSIEEDWNKVIHSVERHIRDRMDKSGLTLPSIAVVGNSHIRVQAPGEKDPEKLIQTLTRLAKLEFRLAHEQYQTAADPVKGMLDEKGNQKPDAVIPKGYELVPYRFGKADKTGVMHYDEGKMLVQSRAAELTGEQLRNTSVQQNSMDIENPIKIAIQFNHDGAEIFGRLTKESSEKFKQGGNPDHLAIMLDGTVISAPKMESAITGGNAEISGGFKFEEAKELSMLFKAGSLPAPLVPESKQEVGASLGTDSIFSGVKALFYGTALIIAFMIAYYGTAGAIAVVALILNVLLVGSIMKLSNSTLTLSGIGGILLTVGMAVDSNVLIYERIREELLAGRPLRQAINHGYDRAFSVIVDSHITTLVSALVLLQFTSGSVYGFALTMVFGLVANLYTGLTVTYALCSLWFDWRGTLGVGKFTIFQNTKFDFIGKRYLTIGGSWALIMGALALVMLTGGLKFGIDFSGGVVAEVAFHKDATETDVLKTLDDAKFEGSRVQSVPGKHMFILRVKSLAGDDAIRATEGKLKETLAAKYGQPGAETFTVERINSFGPETSQQFGRMAITVVILASLAILIYLWFRFELVFGVAAVVALVHDLMMTTLICTLWRVEITLDTVASLMVLLGFSVNDTIVIFDRIRENTKKMAGKGFGEICNDSMNQSLSRTVITSGTVFLVSLVMLLIGGEGLSSFAKVVFLGSIIGTYSSDFIAAPIVYMWDRYKRGGISASLSAKRDSGPEKAKDPMAEPPPRPIAGGVGGNVPRRRGV